MYWWSMGIVLVGGILGLLFWSSGADAGAADGPTPQAATGTAAPASVAPDLAPAAAGPR